MKTNISIELNDDERNHLSNIYHNKHSKQLLTRNELKELVQQLIYDLLDKEVGNFKDVTQNMADEGMIYRFNGVRVTKEVWDKGIHAWLEEQAKNK